MKTLRFFKNLTKVSSPLIAIAMISYSSNSQAAKCASEFKNGRLESKLEKYLNPEGVETLKLYERLSSKTNLAEVLPRSVVLDLLGDIEQPHYARTLGKLLKSVKSLRTFTLTDIQRAVMELLLNKVPARQIEKRAEGLNTPSLKNLRQALGEMTIEEVQELTYGNNPLKPSPESLIGQYIKQTKAKTVVRQFDWGPGRKNKLGPEKLVVAVSSESMGAFTKLMSQINFLYHLHTPEQGTLMTAFDGRVASYGKLYPEVRNAQLKHELEELQISPKRNADKIINTKWQIRLVRGQINQAILRFPEYGSLLPMILLSTSEGNRAQNFFKLASIDYFASRSPWEYKSKSAYCAKGAYNSCTHWIGNIPVGDKKVQAYQFPGANGDEEADNPHVGDGIQTKKLVAFESRKTPLAPVVWQAPGHEQLSHVIGLTRQNNNGEMANPGYVAVSLTARAPVERVPVVFLAVEDHTAKIDKNFDPQISAH